MHKNLISNDQNDELPDLRTYMKDLRTLDKYKFTDHTNYQIYHIFYDLARTIVASYYSMKPEHFNSIYFYRVRLNIDRNKEDLTLAQTYSYPPSVFCSTKGRANIEGKSVFYCSDNVETAIKEVKPKVGDEGYLSVWKGKAIRNLKIGQCLPPKLPLSNHWGEMAEKAFNYLLKATKNENKRNQLEELYKFVAHKFMTEKKPYHITSMISNELLYNQLWRDFIIYPSYIDRGLTCNMAFHPNSVNENLKFEKIIEFKVVELNDNQIVYNLGKKVGFIEKTQMNWKDRSSNETNLFKRQLETY